MQNRNSESFPQLTRGVQEIRTPFACSQVFGTHNLTFTRITSFTMVRLFGTRPHFSLPKNVQNTSTMFQLVTEFFTTETESSFVFRHLTD